MSVNEKMTAIANEIRKLTGESGSMTLDEMAETLENSNAGVEQANSQMKQYHDQTEADSGIEAGDAPEYGNVNEILDSMPEFYKAALEAGVELSKLETEGIEKLEELNGSIGTSSDSVSEVVTLGLDAAIADMKNAYAAIAEKNGTVPTAQTMGGLDEAVRSIPESRDALVASGTLTTSYRGEAAVDCGFQPDFVVINGFLYDHDISEKYEFQISFCFPLKTGGSTYTPAAIAFTTVPEAESIAASFWQETNGFEMVLTYGIGSLNYIANKSFNYTAIKYTK